MRKIIVSNYISLDGMYAGPNDEIDWFSWDDEIAEQSKALLGQIDTILFGRITYQLMAGFWPTEAANTEDPAITRAMNALTKVVFSRTLATVDWANSRLAGDDLAGEVRKLKQAPGRDIVIYGSGEIVCQLADLDLIDRYLLFVNPVILGQGKRLFEGAARGVSLKLADTRSFPSGVVLLSYDPVPATENPTEIHAEPEVVR